MGAAVIANDDDDDDDAVEIKMANDCIDEYDSDDEDVDEGEDEECFLSSFVE